MLAILFYPLLLTAFWLAYLVFKFVSNERTLRQTRLPIIHVPFIDQNSPLWMVFSPVFRLQLKRWLPERVFNKVALTIYGLEFFQRDITQREYIDPQVRANPGLVGGGKTYAIATSGRLELWTWDSEFAKEMYTRVKDFKTFDLTSYVLGVFGDNIFTAKGSEWSRHRRIVAGAVTERVSSVVWNESIRQAQDLMAAVTKSDASDGDTKASSGTSYRFFDFVKRVAIHVLYAAGMGKTQDFQTVFDSKGSDKLPADVRLSYFDAVRIINENTAGIVIFPTPLLRYWPSFLPGADWFHSVGQAKIDFPKHTRKNLVTEREMASSLSEPRNNVMSALIAASERNEDDAEKGHDKASGAGSNTSSAKTPALSDAELVGNLYVFTAAGFDTTANTLAYALILLTRNPKWQTWLFEELDSLIPDPTNPSAYDYQSIFPRSRRALAIMLETLRLFPAVVHLIRMTTSAQAVKLSDGTTLTVPANTTINVNFVALHTDPAIWRNLNMTPLELQAARDDEDNVTTDEHLFRPSRWINTADGSIFKPPPGTYLPWSAGPRVCPGMRMAQVEFVGVLTALFSRHRLEAVRGTKTVKGGDQVVELPESDDALRKRLDGVIDGSQPKLTLEMDLFNVEVDAPGGRGLGLRWIGRR